MSTIAVIIDNMFEDSELTEPLIAFKNEGHKIVTVGIEAGNAVFGKKENSKVMVDRAVRDAAPEEFDALLIPGGYSPDKLRADETAVSFVRAFMESGRPVFAICHGPQLLISAGKLHGRRLTGWKSIVQDIKNAGGEFFDTEVVVDDNLVTSRCPDDLPAFIEACLKKV